MSDLFDSAEIKHGIHGGRIETSMMLHLQPELVDMARAENFTPATVEIERDALNCSVGVPLISAGRRKICTFHRARAAMPPRRRPNSVRSCVERAAGGLVKPRSRRSAIIH